MEKIFKASSLFSHGVSYLGASSDNRTYAKELLNRHQLFKNAVKQSLYNDNYDMNQILYVESSMHKNATKPLKYVCKMYVSVGEMVLSNATIHFLHV